MLDIHGTRDQVKDYYGKQVRQTSDLRTSACCSGAAAMPAHVRDALLNVEPEILQKFYGCGSPIPVAIEGCTVLDLGCGTGRDVYIASQLVGPSGRVIGIDMTPEQLDVARRHVDAQMSTFAYTKPNVEFIEGHIEDLSSAGVADNSVDVVISNCVLNLSADKRQLFAEIFRVLKPGGELYFSDVFAGARVPAELHDDSVLRGECLAGAMYTEDFRRLLADLGCPDYRTVSSSPIKIDDPEVHRRIGMIDFHSRTVRAFKLDNLEDVCEDYGQIAVYRGTIAETPHHYDLDDHHRFFTGKPMLVCGNTAAMLADTRFGKHFEVTGDRTRHFGLFDCSPTADRPTDSGAGGACC